MWTISKDFQGGGEKVGVSSLDYSEDSTASLKFRFQLLDDDGEIYYEGLSNDCDSQRAFAPLDDFGVAYAGCTEIRYFQENTWVPL